MCVNLAEVLRSGAFVDVMLSGEGGSDGVEHRELLFMREKGGWLKGVQSGVRRSVAVCQSLIRGRIETPEARVRRGLAILLAKSRTEMDSRVEPWEHRKLKVYTLLEPAELVNER